MTFPGQTPQTRDARDTFPFEAGRAVIRAFMMGRRSYAHHADSNVIISKGFLGVWIGVKSNPSTVAWFAPDGSLQAKLSPHLMTSYSLRVINEIAMILDPSNPLTVTRETRPTSTGKPEALYFFEGSPVGIDQPFTIAGPLGMSAFRATTKT